MWAGGSLVSSVGVRGYPVARIASSSAWIAALPPPKARPGLVNRLENVSVSRVAASTSS